MLSKEEILSQLDDWLFNGYLINSKSIAKRYLKVSRYKINFYQIAYENWACDAMYDYISKSKDRPAYAAEQWRFMMEKFACKAKTPIQKFQFSVAYDVATDVLDYIMCISPG